MAYIESVDEYDRRIRQLTVYLERTRELKDKVDARTQSLVSTTEFALGVYLQSYQGRRERLITGTERTVKVVREEVGQLNADILLDNYRIMEVDELERDQMFRRNPGMLRGVVSVEEAAQRPEIDILLDIDRMGEELKLDWKWYDGRDE